MLIDFLGSFQSIISLIVNKRKKSSAFFHLSNSGVSPHTILILRLKIIKPICIYRFAEIDNVWWSDLIGTSWPWCRLRTRPVSAPMFVSVPWNFCLLVSYQMAECQTIAFSLYTFSKVSLCWHYSCSHCLGILLSILYSASLFSVPLNHYFVLWF